VIALVLKLFSLGGVIIGPMLGILAEALIAEIVLSIKSAPGLGNLMAAGTFGLMWVVVQPFVAGPLLFGRAILMVWLDFLDSARRVLGLGETSLVLVLGLYVLIHIAAGILAGVVSWNVGKQVRSRLGKPSPNIVEP
jgi:hypothetical protein